MSVKYREKHSLIDCSSTVGFPSNIQHTGSKHFIMGMYENTFWAHFTFETHSVILAATPWNSHMYTGPMIYFDRRVSTYVHFGERPSGSRKPKSKHRRNVSLLGKSDQTMAPAWNENINLASHELICAQVILKCRHSLRLVHELASVFNVLQLGEAQPRCAWRHLNCTWEFHNHRRECVN